MEDKEFDLKLRAMLADAEEEVPSGVWEAVSSRLAPAASPSRGFAAWGWTFAGLAFAACLCAAVFFTGTRRSAPAEPAVEIANGALAYEMPVEAAADYPAGVKRDEFKVPDMIPVDDVEEELPLVGETFEIRESELKVKPLKHRQEEDPFALMVYEDSRMSRKKSLLALQAGGNIGGNEFKGAPGTRYSVGKAAPSAKDNLTETSISQYGIPFTLGIGLRWYVAPKLALGTGIDFSLLSRTFVGDYTPAGGATTSGDVRHTMCYLGIPLTVSYDFVDISFLKFYAYARGTAEYAVSNKYSINAASPAIVLNDPVSGMQFSVGGGLGVEFKFSDTFGLYLNPGAGYYFNCHQPKNLRTDRPLMFTLDAGFRINLR